MATLAVQVVAEAGSDESALTFDAVAAGGDDFPNSKTEILWFKNAGGSPRTVTITSPNKCNQEFTHDVVVTVPATDSTLVPVMSPNRFGTSVSLTYDAATSLSVAVLRVI